MMIAHYMFQERCEVMSLDRLANFVAEEATHWALAPDWGGSRHQVALAEQMRDACASWENFCNLLPNHPLLFMRRGRGPGACDSIEFANAEWKEFLVARYVARSVICRRFTPLLHMGHNGIMYSGIAEQLGDEVVSGADVEQAMKLGEMSPQVIATLCIVLAMSNVRLDQAAVQALLQYDIEDPRFDYGRAIQLYEFCNRVLSGRPTTIWRARSSRNF